jgi:hypothetical protein
MFSSSSCSLLLPSATASPPKIQYFKHTGIYAPPASTHDPSHTHPYHCHTVHEEEDLLERKDLPVLSTTVLSIE